MLERPRSDDEESSLDIAELLNRLWRQWPAMLVAMLCVGALGTLLVMIREPRYASTALLVLERLAPDLGAERTDTSESKVDTEVELLRAISIVELVAARLKAGGAFDCSPEASSRDAPGDHPGASPESAAVQQGAEPPEPASSSADKEGLRRSTRGKAGSAAPLSSAELLEFQRQFRVARRGLTDVIAIEATAETPEWAAMLANLYAEVYLDEQVAAKLSSIQQLQKSLQRRIEEIKRELGDSGAQLELRQLLNEYLSRLNGIRRNQSLIVPDLRLASPALPIAKESFPSRKLLVFLVGLLAGAFGAAVGLYRNRSYLTRSFPFRGSHAQ